MAETDHREEEKEPATEHGWHPLKTDMETASN